MEPPRGPLWAPHGGLKIVGKHQKIYPIKGSMMPTSNFRKVWPLERKIQYGRQSLGLVTPTFFLWEIIQKFFFLSLSFHILATRNNNFCHAGGSQWVPGGLLGHFRIFGSSGQALQKLDVGIMNPLIGYIF